MDNKKSALIEFLEMELAWVRTVRRGRNVALVAPALDRETELLQIIERLQQEDAA
jgi:hypothetical protein